MNEPLIKKWVKALRSEKYKQGIGKLYNSDNNTFCCLGVLAHVSGLKKSEIHMSGRKHKSKTAHYNKKFIKKHNLEKLSTSELAATNDNGDSFKNIADYIEETYLGGEK